MTTAKPYKTVTRDLYRYAQLEPKAQVDAYSEIHRFTEPNFDLALERLHSRLTAHGWSRVAFSRHSVLDGTWEARLSVPGGDETSDLDLALAEFSATAIAQDETLVRTGGGTTRDGAMLEAIGKLIRFVAHEHAEAIESATESAAESIRERALFDITGVLVEFEDP